MDDKQSNFRVPVYKGVSLPWMKWNSSFNDDRWPTMRVSKPLLSEKWVLNDTTSGFHPLTITGGQLYECEKFRFLKKC